MTHISHRLIIVVGLSILTLTGCAHYERHQDPPPIRTETPHITVIETRPVYSPNYVVPAPRPYTPKTVVRPVLVPPPIKGPETHRPHTPDRIPSITKPSDQNKGSNRPTRRPDNHRNHRY